MGQLEVRERLERERLERERLERERLERQQAERERLEREQAERDRAERERLERAERDRAAREAARQEEERALRTRLVMPPVDLADAPVEAQVDGKLTKSKTRFGLGEPTAPRVLEPAQSTPPPDFGVGPPPQHEPAAAAVGAEHEPAMTARDVPFARAPEGKVIPFPQSRKEEDSAPDERNEEPLRSPAPSDLLPKATVREPSVQRRLERDIAGAPTQLPGGLGETLTGMAPQRPLVPLPVVAIAAQEFGVQPPRSHEARSHEAPIEPPLSTRRDGTSTSATSPPSERPPRHEEPEGLHDGFFSAGEHGTFPGGHGSVPPEELADDDVAGESRHFSRTPEQEARRARLVRVVAVIVGFGLAVFLVAALVVISKPKEQPSTELPEREPASSAVALPPPPPPPPPPTVAVEVPPPPEVPAVADSAASEPTPAESAAPPPPPPVVAPPAETETFAEPSAEKPEVKKPAAAAPKPAPAGDTPPVEAPAPKPKKPAATKPPPADAPPPAVTKPPTASFPVE